MKLGTTEMAAWSNPFTRSLAVTKNKLDPMDPIPENNDLHRYIEFLQRQLLTPGWEAFFDPHVMQAWLAKNAGAPNATFQQYGGATSPVAHLEELVHKFQPTTAFDSPETQAIFAPILEKVKRAAEEINLRVHRPIQIVTSTNISPSPAVRPAGGPHFLFIGLGTSSFCNYWAKAFTAIVKVLEKRNPTRRFASAEEVESALRSDPSGVVFAAKLALAYGIYGSLIGFGQVNEPLEHWPYRAQLLDSMEVFVVGHEFAHLIADEQVPEFQGILDVKASRKLEYFCDQLAIQISKRYANHEDNFLSFAGLGAILLFRAMELSEYALERISSIHGRSGLGNTLRYAESQPSGYPSLTARIDRMKSLAVALTADDQRQGVADFIEEYDLIASYLVCTLKELLGTIEP